MGIARWPQFLNQVPFSTGCPAISRSFWARGWNLDEENGNGGRISTDGSTRIGNKEEWREERARSSRPSTGSSSQTTSPRLQIPSISDNDMKMDST